MKRFNIPVDSTRGFTRHGKSSTLLSTGGTYSTKKLNLDTKLKGVIKCYFSFTAISTIMWSGSPGNANNSCAKQMKYLSGRACCRLLCFVVFNHVQNYFDVSS